MTQLAGLVRLPLGPERHFGQHTLVVKLGWGGMADVFLATPKSDPHAPPMVVKRLKTDMVFDPEYRAMFKDEAKLALQFAHPNIVKTYDAGEIDGQPYLTMEYLEGRSLDRILASGQRLPRAQVLLIMRGLLSGLDHAHDLRDEAGNELGIVHRDVSPHNVFITYEGDVKLVDFGIAKSRLKANHTMTGVVKGKISYMAPEQALCAPVDHRADVFAAGIILWELVTGERFWGNLSEVQILKTMTFGELPSLEEKMPNASPDLARILEKALSITRETRYATAREFRDDVDAFLEKLNENVTAADLGTSIGNIFEGERRTMQRTIDHELAELRGERREVADSKDKTPVGLELPAEAQASALAFRERETLPEVSEVSRSAAMEALGGETTDLTRAPAPVWRGRRSKAVWPVALGLLALVVLIGGGVLFKSVSGPPTPVTAPASTQAPAVVVPPPSVAASTAEPEATQTPEDGLVEVKVLIDPPQARFSLDGVVVPGRPFTARFAKNATAHAIKVELVGYETFSEMLVFDRDVVREIKLERRGWRPPVQTTRPTGQIKPRSTGVVDETPPWKTTPKR